MNNHRYRPPYKSNEIIIQAVAKHVQLGRGRGCIIFGKDMDQYFAEELKLDHWGYDYISLFQSDASRMLMDTFDFEEDEEIEIVVRRKKK